MTTDPPTTEEGDGDVLVDDLVADGVTCDGVGDVDGVDPVESNDAKRRHAKRRRCRIAETLMNNNNVCANFN